MRGVVFKGNREAEIREFPDPHAGPGEAVVKIRASGLCGTDLHRYLPLAVSGYLKLLTRRTIRLGWPRGLDFTFPERSQQLSGFAQARDF